MRLAAREQLRGTIAGSAGSESGDVADRLKTQVTLKIETGAAHNGGAQMSGRAVHPFVKQRINAQMHSLTPRLRC